MMSSNIKKSQFSATDYIFKNQKPLMTIKKWLQMKINSPLSQGLNSFNSSSKFLNNNKITGKI